MKRGFRQFDPPVTERLGEDEAGKEVTLSIPSAGKDGRGGTVATLEVWNGNLLHKNRVNLTHEPQRQRFAKAVAGCVSTLKQEEIACHLLVAEASLAAALDQPEPAAAAAPVDVAALWEKARPLAEDPELMDRVARAAAGLGLVGEEGLVKLGYLAATARLLPEPVNLILKGPPSGGKSFTLECVVRLLPESAFVNYTSVSARYLAYCDDDLRNRIVVLYEAQGMDEEGPGAYIMRSLLSEGRLDMGTVDRTEGGSNEARRLTKEGPTALFTSTVRLTLEGQMETRTFSLGVDDSSDQSREVVIRQAAAAAAQAPQPPDLAPFHALQEWITAAGERRVIIPYAPAIARLVPCNTIRIRRDFPRLLSIISACAMLHQAQRGRAAGGEIIATVADYEIVRELLADAFTAAQQGGLTKAQRGAVEAVRSLCSASATGLGGVSVEAVAAKLGIDRSVAQRHLAGARRGGYLRNLETRRGRYPAAYVEGEPLPPEDLALPSKEELVRAVGAPNEPSASRMMRV